MPQPLVDICFNFTHSAFRKDERAVLERAVAAGVTTLMVTGSSADESRRCVELAERYPDHLYATAGVHPHLAREWNETTLGRLRELAGCAKVKAIGEAGLDYNRDYSPRDVQRRVFEQQIELACELNLPLFLHQRDAHEEFIEILGRYRLDLPPAVAHCFTGEREHLETCLAMDLHIGITGWICDERRGRHLYELLPLIPSERLMVETDAPYLLPRDLKPPPAARRNEPAFLPHIVETIARCLDRPFGDVAAVTTANARRFFDLERETPDRGQGDTL